MILADGLKKLSSVNALNRSSYMNALLIRIMTMSSNVEIKYIILFGILIVLTGFRFESQSADPQVLPVANESSSIKIDYRP